MNNVAALDDIDMIYEDVLKQPKKAHERETASKVIKVRSSVEKAQDTYKSAKKTHKASIRLEKRKIKSYKILIHQARNAYKLVKLSNK